MPSEFRETAEDLNTRDSVQVDVEAKGTDQKAPLADARPDVEAIRARLDAARRLGRSNPAYLDALESITRHVPRLLDENARLNAEFADFREMAVLNTRAHNEALAARDRTVEALSARLTAKNAELDKVIREAAADKARLAAKVEAANAKVAEWDLSDEEIDMIASDSSPVRRAEKWLKLTSYRVCAQSLRSALADAAPEMPRPPAEEAQERPETAGTGSGRGTGELKAQGTAQASDG